MKHKVEITPEVIDNYAILPATILYDHKYQTIFIDIGDGKYKKLMPGCFGDVSELRQDWLEKIHGIKKAKEVVDSIENIGQAAMELDLKLAG